MKGTGFQSLRENQRSESRRGRLQGLRQSWACWALRLGEDTPDYVPDDFQSLPSTACWATFPIGTEFASGAFPLDSSRAPPAEAGAPTSPRQNAEAAAASSLATTTRPTIISDRAFPGILRRCCGKEDCAGMQPPAHEANRILAHCSCRAAQPPPATA
jgi:hypothetical protein